MLPGPSPSFRVVSAASLLCAAAGCAFGEVGGGDSGGRTDAARDAFTDAPARTDARTGDGAGPVMEAGPDARADSAVPPDAGSDAREAATPADTGSDARPDATADAHPDAGTDAGAESGLDAGVDARAEAGPDAPADTASETGVDAGPEAATDAATGPSAACLSALTTARFDFETGSQGWTHANLDGVSAAWPIDPWEVSLPTNSLGPSAAHGGSVAFGTGLNQNYAQCTRAELRSPVMNLSSCAGAEVHLTFWHWYRFTTTTYSASTYYDGGFLEISSNGGTTWSASTGLTYPGTVRPLGAMTAAYACLSSTTWYVAGKPGYVGTGPSGWTQVDVRIPAAMVTSTFRMRLVFGGGVAYQTTNASTSRNYTAPGWYLDDVAVTAR